MIPLRTRVPGGRISRRGANGQPPPPFDLRVSIPPKPWRRRMAEGVGFAAPALRAVLAAPAALADECPLGPCRRTLGPFTASPSASTRGGSFGPPLVDGGGGGIRTHGARKRTTVFETAPFDHSGTPPRGPSLQHWAIYRVAVEAHSRARRLAQGRHRRNRVAPPDGRAPNPHAAPPRNEKKEMRERKRRQSRELAGPSRGPPGPCRVRRAPEAAEGAKTAKIIDIPPPVTIFAAIAWARPLP